MNTISQEVHVHSHVLVLLLLCTLLWGTCTQNSPVQHEPDYPCNWDGKEDIDYLNAIACPDEMYALAGPPLVPVTSEVKSIKIVYEISTRRVYFFPYSKYPLHYTFCRDVLGYTESHSTFNAEQYRDGSQRLFYSASINYYSSSGLYTLELFAGDQIIADGIKTIYDAVAEKCFFGDKLNFYTNSSRFVTLLPELQTIPVITEEEIYAGQNYQALNPGEAYGWLKKNDIEDLEDTNPGRHDILLVNGLPLDIPVIAGIITSVFQTPLSHINVLSHNRGTPNMALKTAWGDSSLNQLIDKLVHLTVTSDSFSIEETTLEKAQSFWEDGESTEPIILECDDDTSGLFDIHQITHKSIPLVGAKAANLGKLARITLSGDSLPIPEGAFAIPFFYYRRHMESSGLDDYVNGMVQDSIFNHDFARRKNTLQFLRDSIAQYPIDSNLAKAVKNRIEAVDGFTSFRFRSSTNAEDIKGFNGAGLYESYSAVLNDPEKTVERAIKKVYASLWTLRGFEEREYFNIDHGSAAMGILVHRSFPGEEVNGVAITKNIYNANIRAFTVNVQIKSISVVKPPAGFTADQFLYYTLSNDALTNPNIEYVTRSNVNDGNPVMMEKEIVHLAGWLNAIHRHFYFRYFSAAGVSYYDFAMDVEFKLDRDSRKLYIKQARPY